jgi:hypothetical protein
VTTTSFIIDRLVFGDGGGNELPWPGPGAVLAVRIGRDATNQYQLYLDIVTPTVDGAVPTTTEPDVTASGPQRPPSAANVECRPGGDSPLPIYSLDLALPTPRPRRRHAAGLAPVAVTRGPEGQRLSLRGRAVESALEATVGDSGSTRRLNRADRAASPTWAADVALGRGHPRRRLLTLGIAAAVVVLAATTMSSRSRPDPAAVPPATTAATGSFIAAATVRTSSPTNCQGLSPASAELLHVCTSYRNLLATTSPVLASACRHLIDVAAHAVGADPDTYSGIILASAREGQTLNEAVHQQLNDERAFRARELENRSRFWSDPDIDVGLPALDVAIADADATPCSPHDAPPTPSSPWPITEPP